MISAMTTSAIDRFLDAVTAGVGIPAHLYAADAQLDATVPGWRFELRGPEAITGEYARWFDHPSRFEELDRHVLPGSGGEVVTYFQSWEEDGATVAAHHCHVITLDESGRIAKDHVWCGGRWNAALLAEMGAAAHAG
jgi:hypothetical protein